MRTEFNAEGAGAFVEEVEAFADGTREFPENRGIRGEEGHSRRRGTFAEGAWAFMPMM
jgi:hypothetical protein